MAMILAGCAIALAAPSQAAPTDDGDFGKLQADAQKSFREDVIPFVGTYCTQCHGHKKRKGGINYQIAFKEPGSAAFRKQWKQALANVKAHDMPPEDADKQPTDEERQKFRGLDRQDQVSQPEGSGAVCHPPADQGGVRQHAA